MTSMKSAKQFELIDYIKREHDEFMPKINEFDEKTSIEEYSIDFIINEWHIFLKPLYELRALDQIYDKHFARCSGCTTVCTGYADSYQIIKLEMNLE